MSYIFGILYFDILTYIFLIEFSNDTKLEIKTNSGPVFTLGLEAAILERSVSTYSFILKVSSTFCIQTTSHLTMHILGCLETHLPSEQMRICENSQTDGQASCFIVT